MVVNTLWLLPRTDYFDTGSFIVELACSHVQKVAEHKELFKGEGYDGFSAGQDKKWGCATCNYVGVVFNLSPQ